jgi:hypothetical protein
VSDVDGNSFDGSDRELTVLTTTPTSGAQSQAWGNRLMLCNGVDEPLVFNGRYADRAGFGSRPGQPVATPLDTSLSWRTSLSSLGLGRLAVDIDDLECAYRYIVTFVNERGNESPPSAPSEAAIVTNSKTARSFIFLEIPVGDSSTVARRIYRTRNMYNSDGESLDLGFGADFYFLMEIQDNFCTSVEDGFPDTNLGSLFDSIDFGFFPTTCQYMASFKDTLFIATVADGNIKFSAPLFPEVFPEDNILEIGDDSLGECTGMRPTKNALVVFKQRGIYLVRGDPSNGFTADTLTRDVGCIAPNSIRELPGIGLIFLAHDGVYVLRGALENTGTPTDVTCISQPIPDFIEKLNRAASIGAFGEIYHLDREYWLAVPTLGSIENDLILVFHYEVGAWSTRINTPARAMVESRDHRGYLFIASRDDTNKPGIMVYSHGWADKLDGDDIEAVYETATMDFGSVYGTAHPAYALVQCVGHGDNELTLEYIVNHDLDGVRTREDVPALSVAQQDPNNTFPVYGTAVWGTDRWSALRPVVLRYDLSGTSQGPVRELALVFAPDGRRVSLIAYDLEAKVGEQRLMKPLSDALNPDKR